MAGEEREVGSECRLRGISVIVLIESKQGKGTYDVVQKWHVIVVRELWSRKSGIRDATPVARHARRACGAL